MTKPHFVKVFTLLSVLCLFLFANPFNKFAEENPETMSVIVNPEKLISYEEKYRDYTHPLFVELNEKGFPAVIDLALLPDEKIEFIIKPTTKEVTKETLTKVEEIATEFLKRNALNSFKVTVLDYDTISQDSNSSIRLTHNDLLGYIVDRLMKENYKVGMYHTLSEKHTVLDIKLTKEDFNEKTKSRIEQIANDTIKDKKFKGLFQINITPYEN